MIMVQKNLTLLKSILITEEMFVIKLTVYIFIIPVIVYVLLACLINVNKFL